ncbi:hypothetical protein PTSG_04284 [Salpingoeca rosetta]|uniref:Cilia- and flagella-associated protein 91 n=1 Tax=Salpingoeca rosetta (strain ATCC 50818 / BSB-021) TaxID=946362 RepID=F2U746_SALR5|nr:uncharacterized protein PTSG_04284 [Salpingoeca rosetta]EGD83678.1 hypothetical protein PTSG_04284 [Salpingoeca rosetta]|eukprot:XP_004995182.1 hypothetical protein PTSG_04284 [Salpingoeca rosetta]
MASKTRTVTVKKPTGARRFDAVYDKDYYVSGERDHTRAMTQAMTRDAPTEPVPDSQNMFSDLRHFPRSTVKVGHQQALPEFVDTQHQTETRAMQAQADYEQAQPRGRDLFKYAHQPLTPVTSAFMDFNPLLRLDEGSSSAEQLPRELPPGTMVTTATQTDYRESATQTDPYTPEYTVRPGSAPEVLTLATLSYGYGLPAGLAEVEMIERARERRAWESQLPPADDAYRSVERARAMEEQELREWKHREDQIQQIQDERLQLLQQLVVELQEKKQMAQDEKLEKAYQQRQAALDRRRAKAELEGVMRLRKLARTRRNVEHSRERRNIVREYADTGSQTFAPAARTGAAARIAAQRKAPVRPRQLGSYDAIVDLEANLPRAITTPRIRTGSSKRQHGKSANARAKLKQTLERLDETFSMQRQGTLPVLPPIRSIEKVEKPKERPPTPEVNAPCEADQRKEQAVMLLQSLIRGRAAQNEMYEGKERRRDMITELRTTHALSKAQQEIKEKEKQDALKLRERQAVERRRRQLLDWVVTDVQAEQVGGTIDFLSKELVRLQEERRVHAFAMLAERERRLREAEEAGRRQQEEKQRALNDEVFRQVMDVHRGTLDSYLEDIIMESEEQVADEQARATVRERVSQINKVADEMHASGYDATEEGAAQITADLVSSFLLPEVEREAKRREVQRHQRRFLVAAHKMATEASSQTESKRRPQSSAAQQQQQQEDEGAETTTTDATTTADVDGGAAATSEA